MRYLLTLLLLLTAPALAQHSGHLPLQLAPPITTPKDSVPDFCGAPTVSSVKEGHWRDPATWGGRIPVPADLVRVAHDVSYSGTSRVQCVGVKGRLWFEPDAASSLTAGDIMVYPEGKLHAGTVAEPVTGSVEIVIADKPLDTATDPLRFGTGLINFGERIMHGAAKATWVRLAREPKAGDTTIELEQAPLGWRPGDRLVIPDSKQYPLAYQSSTLPPKFLELQIELPPIAAVAGNVVTLAEPLKFDHPGGRDSDGKLIALPHVGNRTHNVVIRSESPAGTRGHTLDTARARLDIRYVEHASLGRTTSAALGGANQAGRYPIHPHHLMGPVNPTNTGYQFVIVGVTAHDCRKLCASLHSAHFGLVSDFFFYDAQGAALWTEQGNERENVIERGFAVKIGRMQNTPYNPTYGGVGGPGRPLGFPDAAWDGSAYWFTGLDNYVRDLVAANVAYAGIMYNARSPSGFAHHHPLVPKIRGADITVISEWEDYKKPFRGAPPVRESRRIEVYASTVGMWAGFSGAMGTLENYLLWNIRQNGSYAQRNTSVVLDNFRIYSDQAVSNTHSLASPGMISKGLDFGSCVYNLTHVAVRRSRVEGFNLGVMGPANVKPNSVTLWPGSPTGAHLDTVTLRNAVNLKDYATHPGRTTLANVTETVNPAPVNKWIAAGFKCPTQ